MNLSEILKLKKKSLVSIAGSGGKTTLMYLLANELKLDNRVLLSTTTKIYAPKGNESDFLAIGSDEYNYIKNLKYNGIYVYGASKNDEGKLIGINKEDIEKCISDFDYTIVESDGSKKRPIKGWNEGEPVIYDKTNVTIGVMSFESLGKIIDEKNVHRISEFNKLTGGSTGEIITINYFIRIIFGENGLFKNSKGERILFLNKVEEGVDLTNLESLLNKIIESNNEHTLLNKIIFGSLKNNSFKYIEL